MYGVVCFCLTTDTTLPRERSADDFLPQLRTNRSGQATAVLGAVRARHNELLKIEQQMTELAQLIQDLDTLIIQQEPMVQQIDEHVEKTHEDLKEANTELDTAVETRRATRKKKWICCGIVSKYKSWPKH